MSALSEETELLMELMRVVQKDCFEKNKLSMEEYAEAMSQYESRLSDIIQEKVTTETQLANMNKLRGRKKALIQEKIRLTELIREAQDDYLNKAKLDSRVYGNMLRSYANRLSKVQEELAFMDAQRDIAKLTGFWQNFWRIVGI